MQGCRDALRLKIPGYGVCVTGLWDLQYGSALGLECRDAVEIRCGDVSGLGTLAFGTWDTGLWD